MFNKMLAEENQKVLNLANFTFIPNFEIRTMTSKKSVAKYDIFLDGKEKVLENINMTKFVNYLEPRLF